jgi:hypothetical protein
MAFLMAVNVRVGFGIGDHIIVTVIVLLAVLCI